MFDTAPASNDVKLALLEGQLLTREIDRDLELIRDQRHHSIDDGDDGSRRQTCQRPALIARAARF
jgi:hypothetical protein